MDGAKSKVHIITHIDNNTSSNVEDSLNKENYDLFLIGELREVLPYEGEIEALIPSLKNIPIEEIFSDHPMTLNHFHPRLERDDRHPHFKKWYWK